MNKVITATITAASIFSFNAAAKVVPADSSRASQICAAAANDKVSKVRRLLKQEHKTIRKAAQNIQCDGKPLAQFLQDMNAAKVAKNLYPNNDAATYIAKR